jgi:hypothetical protein
MTAAALVEGVSAFRRVSFHTWAVTGFVLYDFGVHGTSVFSGRSGLVAWIVLFAAGQGEGGNSERGDPNRNLRRVMVVFIGLLSIALVEVWRS